MTKWRWVSLVVIPVAGGLLAIGLLVLPKSPIPSTIKRQVTSTLLVPHAPSVLARRESVKYDEKLKLLTFTVVAFGANLVVSEQPTPDSFVDIPQAYDKVVADMNEYAKFDSDIGTAHLTRPKELSGKQTAVLNTKGTLMFAKAESDLSEDQWRQFFKAMEVVK